MVAAKIIVYTFRGANRSGNTVISAAAQNAVVSAYGGGGMFQSAGLSKVFRGAAYFKDDATGQYHLGVWGARNASRFRQTLREAGFEIEMKGTPPPGRLLAWGTQSRSKATKKMQWVIRNAIPLV